MTPRETLSAYLRALPPAALERVADAHRWCRGAGLDRQGRRCLTAHANDVTACIGPLMVCADPVPKQAERLQNRSAFAFDQLAAADLPALVASLQAEARGLLETTP